VRTWTEWNEDRPGFTEMDLVAHDGGDVSGDFAHTLDFTDIKTGWTECAAAQNKQWRKTHFDLTIGGIVADWPHLIWPSGKYANRQRTLPDSAHDLPV
jgi:hypothetical protein